MDMKCLSIHRRISTHRFVIGYDNEKISLPEEINRIDYCISIFIRNGIFYRLDIIVRENWHRLLQTYNSTMNMYLITLGKAVFLTTKNYNRLA